MSKVEISPKELIQAGARQLRQDFEEIRKSNPHAGESGTEAELILEKFLKDRLPRRFDVQTGIVIGAGATVSKQTDLIVFDALNSPIYRTGPRLHIIPRDNVAAVVEVKSKLNKEELRDAAEKIASVKRMRASPISNLDQPVTFSGTIVASTLGCVFAYDSYTSLDSLAENLRNLNEHRESREWIDLVVVLGKGTLSYTVQFPFSQNFPGWFGNTAEEPSPVLPIYVYLTESKDPDLALNQFFLKLMTHLAFFRKITTLDFEGVLGVEKKEVVTIQAYQHNLSRRLVPVEPAHQAAHFENPKVRFNLYSRQNREFLGQVCLWPWQDGAAITCSVRFDHRLIFEHYFRSFRQNGVFFNPGEIPLWVSSIMPVTEDQFIEASENIHPDLIVVRDSPDEEPPPAKLPL